MRYQKNGLWLWAEIYQQVMYELFAPVVSIKLKH